MKDEFSQIVEKLGKQEKSFASLYRQLASRFALSECGMWVLYFLLVTNGDLTQQDLSERMMFPKQTIHSAIKKLVDQGYLTLTAIPHSKNRKKIDLTQKGEVLAQDTVAKMLQAERSAIAQMGYKKMMAYAELQGDYYRFVEASFIEAGILEGKNDD